MFSVLCYTHTPEMFVMNSAVEEKHNFVYDYYHSKLEVFRDIVFRYDYRLNDGMLAVGIQYYGVISRQVSAYWLGIYINIAHTRFH